MKYKKFAATALLAAAATGISAGTSYAAPSAPAIVQDQVTTVPSVNGQEQGVSYTAQLVNTGKSIVTSVTGGAFSLDADQKAVTVKNATGAVVATVPLVANVDNKAVAIAATIDASGQQLTLTPDASQISATPRALPIGYAQDRFFGELQRASLGALIGGLIGLLFFIGGAVPGAIIGLLVAGGPSLIDAGVAYFSGQP